MSKFIPKIEHVPSFEEYSVSRRGLGAILQLVGAEKVYLWDYKYYYVSHEDWGRVFEDVLLNQPKYTKDKFDCEDFAMLTTTRILEKYKLNTCGIAIGGSPFGEHGYNIFISQVDGEARVFILEPQNGMVYPIENPEGYKPRILIFG